MFYAGLDLGQKHDFSAIAVVEREDERRRGLSSSVMKSLRVRHLERVPLGTPYAEVAAGCRHCFRKPSSGRRSNWWWMRRAWAVLWWRLLRAVGLPCRVTSVTITGGRCGTRSRE